MSVIERNHVVTAGAGDKPMIFAHGFGCDQNMWRFVAPAFEKDFLTVLYDHVGAGKSDLSAYDPEKYATARWLCGRPSRDRAGARHQWVASSSVIRSVR